MSTLQSISIEPRLVPTIAEALLTIYAAQADALHHATNDRLAGASPFSELDVARRALWETESALDGLGWGAPAPSGPAELAGSPELMHDTLTAAVIGAAEQVADACREYTRARVELTRVREAFEHLADIHALFTRHEHDSAV